MGKKKTIWIFHHYATPPTMNGFTRPYNFGTRLQKMGYDIKIFSASHLHFSDINLIKNNKLYLENDESGVPFVFVKTPSASGNGIKRLWNMISYYKNLFKVTKQLIKKGDKPDVIIGSSPHPLAMVAAIKIAKQLNIPCINEIRDFWPEVIFLGGKLKETSLIGKSLLRGEYWIYRNSNALIFLKEGDSQYILDRKWDTLQGGSIDMKKCFYINNGVDLKKFSELQKDQFFDKDLVDNKFNVIYAGAIRPINNVDKLLDAAKIVEKKEKSIQFLIFGEGNQLERLKQRIDDEHITNIIMKGYVDKKYIPNILSESSANILTYSQSKYNWSRGNSSNKLFEYMASGKPIISTVQMGYSPIEKFNCGITVENDTAEGLATSIMEVFNMSSSEYLEVSQNALKAAKNFDYDVLSEKLKIVIEKQFADK